MKIDIRQTFTDFHPLIKLIFDVLMVILIFVIVFMIGSMISASVQGITTDEFLGNMSKSDNPNVVRFSQLLSSASLFLIPPIIVSFFYSRNTFKFFGLNKSAFPVNYFNIIFLIMTSLPIVNALAMFNDGIHLPGVLSGLEEVFRSSGEKAKVLQEKLLATSDVNDLIFNLIVFALMPALGEEIFFRGLFQKHLIEWTKNEHIGVFIAAIVFSAFHFQFSNFIPILFLGIVLGYLYVWSKSLWLPIFAHFVNNSMAVVASFFYFKKTNSLDMKIDSFGANSETFLYTIFSLLMFSLIMFFIYRNEKRKSLK